MCFAQYDTHPAFLRENERDREGKRASNGEMSLGGTTKLLYFWTMRGGFTLSGISCNRACRGLLRVPVQF